MTIAQTILEQLGGRRFTVMTGAKNYVDHGNALSFHLGRNSSRANVIKITLDPSDTYTLEMGRYSRKNLEYTVLETTSDIYAEDLTRIFTQKTGLATRL